MNIELADAIRRLAFGQAFVIAILTIWTIVRYMGKAIVVPATDRALPLHVALIATSYLCMVSFVVQSLRERMGEALSWRTPLSFLAFSLGLGALVFMMAHLSARRILSSVFRLKVEAEATKEMARQVKRAEDRMQRMEEVGQHTHDNVQEMKESVDVAAQKADMAFHEANDLNTKIVTLQGAVNNQLTDIKGEAEIAKTTAKEVSDKAEAIGETGHDTNVRVRNIEDLTPRNNVQGGRKHRNRANQNNL